MMGAHDRCNHLTHMHACMKGAVLGSKSRTTVKRRQVIGSQRLANAMLLPASARINLEFRLAECCIIVVSSNIYGIHDLSIHG